MGRNKKPSQSRTDKERDEIEMMFRATGTEPRGGIVNWLLRKWARDMGKAQARGVHIRQIIEKENHGTH